MRISDWSSDVCSSDLVPFAMASKLAQPEKEVLCLFGDGSFSLTGWDFETMVRFGLPFIGVIGNNSHMNQIRYGQIMKYGAERGEVGNKLGEVHYSTRPEERRVGKDSGRTCRTRVAPDP